MSGELLQFAGSLAAILVLAAIAWKLGLGGDARIRDEAHLRELVDEALCGFEAREIAIDPDGAAALASDGDGRVMLIRRHGARFAARLLDRSARAHVREGRIVVDPADRRFGTVTLDLGGDAAAWAERIEAL